MTVHPSLNQARRAARVRKVVEEVMSRRAAGESLTDSEVVGVNAELMPELAKELSVLALLERARTVAHARTSDGVVRRPPAREGLPRMLAPDAFEGYELSGEVHRGGQGVVYEARQCSTGRRVAIKVMREGVFGDDRDTARFEREVRILGQLDHPGIVGILASGVHAGHFYYVMDYVDGLPLDRHAAERCASVRERLEVFLRVCEAVSAAHVRGIIHRDLKPANILVDERGQPRILDFGLARVTAEWAAAGGARMTHTGHFVGSMPWASPEQAMSDPDKIDTRTDIYSLGVVLYQVLTGRFPYRVEGGPRDVLDQILTAEPARPRSIAGVSIDEDLEAVVLKCLAKERERRYQSAGELAEDLRRYLGDRPVLARPPSAAYQVRSFVRRNRALVIGAAAVAGALVLGLVGTSVGLVEASAGRLRAESARDDAKRSESRAQEQLAESQRLAYVASIAAADSALRSDDVASAEARLAAAPEALRSWEWSYLSGRLDQSEIVLRAPRVLHAGVSPDGGLIAELTADGRVRTLDQARLEPTWEAAVPRDAASQDDQTISGLSGDSRLLATAHGPILLVWRIGEPGPIARFGFPGTTWGFTNVAFDPSGTRLVAAGRAGRMSAWEIPSGKVIREYPEDDRYFGVAWGGGDTVVVGSNHGPLLFNGTTMEFQRGLLDNAEFVAELSGLFRLSPDGSHLAIAKGTEVMILPFPAMDSQIVLRGHTQYLGAIGFSPDGREVVTAGWDRTVRVWDAQRGVQERSLIGHTGMINAVGFLGDGTRIMSSARDGSVRIWDLTRSPRSPSVPIPGVVQTLSFLSGGARLFAASAGQARCWDVHDGTLTTSLDLHTGDAGYAAPAADGARLLLPRLDGEVTLIDTVSRAPVWRATGPNAASYRCLESPDGKLIASASADGTLRLWDAATGAPLQKLEFGEVSLGPLPPSFSPDSRLIALPAGSGVTVWECATGRRVATLQPETHGERPRYSFSVAFSPDGARIVTGDSAGKATMWDRRTFQPIRVMTGMEPGVWSVAFDPAGKRLATGSQDRTIRVWDPETGQEMLVLRGHTGTIMTLAWSPDGRTLASGSHDGVVRLWRADATSPAR